ncbi:unnamed protein product [Didymodactylos carnosus]|uniref:Biogenesis of lysosome-related organelles complex 1 subunit 1 n=1 Tax=Didymodactylos carnosus TaxID=1234261 RepID=A0A8S2EH65_9BILA|nr:unnamed protein product [Didymodactylos carnosus]CAF4014074.1 unnamed protein product [Didymodactylos carnosus]
MFANIYRQHSERTANLKQKQEKTRKEFLNSSDQFTRHVIDRLNDDVAECYVNEKKIDTATKQLTNQSTVLVKQSQAWIQLIDQFTTAVKELGDVENWSKIIEKECLTITSALTNVHKDLTIQ